MKGLIISYFFPPCGGGATRRVESFIKYASENNFSFDILSVKPDYYPSIYLKEKEFSLPPSFSLIRTKSLEPKKSFRDAVFTIKEEKGLKKILLILGKFLYRNFIVPDQFITWLPYGIKEGMNLTRIKKYDFVLSTAPPFTSHIIGWALKKIKNIPLILDYRDLWNGSEFFKKTFPSSIMSRMLEGRILSSSSLAIVTTEEARLKLRSIFKIKEEKTFVLSNGYDFTPPQREIPDYPPFKILHAGSLTPERPPLSFLIAMKNLLQRGEIKKNEVRVTFMGFIHRDCLMQINNSGLEEIIELKKDDSYEEAIEEMKKAHILLVLQSRKNGGDTAIPGKFYDYLAMRKPILIIDEDGATTKFAKSLGINLISHIKDSGDIEDKLRYILLNYSMVLEEFNFPDHIIEQYHRSNLSKKLFKKITEVLKEENSSP